MFFYKFFYKDIEFVKNLDEFVINKKKKLGIDMKMLKNFINGISPIEYRIKNWIDLFLKESREEWELLLEKESIEERNWRLLKEIEDMLLKKQ